MISRIPDLDAAKQHLMKCTAARGRAMGNVASAQVTWNAANTALGLAIARGCRLATDLEVTDDAEWCASQLLQGAQDRQEAAERALISARMAYDQARRMHSRE